MDRLPPHSPEAEAGVLGCVLLQPGLLAKASERLEGHPEAFFDLRHRGLWVTLRQMASQGEAIDLITLGNRLTDGRLLEQVGGLAYVCALPDSVPSTENLGYYLDIVFEKYVARRYIQDSVGNVTQIYEGGGLPELAVARIHSGFEEWKRLSLSQAGSAPEHIVDPFDFADECLDVWFKRKVHAGGWELPVTVSPELRLRHGHSTVMTAESGAGKSTFLYHLAVHLRMQGAKVFVASLEEAVPDILWTMTRQALGATRIHLDDTPENLVYIRQGLEWLQGGVKLYNFLGIGDWREVLRCFRHLRREEGFDVGIFDSLTKGGIADDDYAQQTVAANAFADLSLTSGLHSIMVIHQNKAEGKDIKRKMRGAGTLSDVPNQVLGIRRNEKKDEKLADLHFRLGKAERELNDPRSEAIALEAAKREIVELNNERSKIRADWDSELRLVKQRWKGAVHQNASRRVYFDRASQQFKTDVDEAPRCYVSERPRRVEVAQ